MKLLRYDEWLKEQVKYTDCKCGVYGCDKPGLYEGGDSRCWFPACEEHAYMKQRYLHYCKQFKIVKLTEIDVEIAYNKILNAQDNLEKAIKEAINGNKIRK